MKEIIEAPDNSTQVSNQIVMKKKSFAYVDLLKLLFAILIFLLHAMIIDESWVFTKIVVRIGVPFFFVASGFFWHNKIQLNKENSWKFTWGFIKRLLIMLLVFEPISLAIYVVKSIYSGLSFLDIFSYSARSIIFYPLGALWYIQATIISVLCLFLFIKYDKHLLAIIIGLFLYLIALIMNNYFFLIENTPLSNEVSNIIDFIISGRNGLFFGFLFVGIGAFISKHQNTITNKRLFVTIAFFISYIILIAEVLLIKGKTYKDDQGLFLSLVLVAPLLFIISISYKRFFTDNTLILRNLSTSIYLLHAPIFTVIRYLFEVINNKHTLPIQPNLISFFCSIIVITGIILFAYRRRGIIFKLIT